MAKLLKTSSIDNADATKPPTGNGSTEENAIVSNHVVAGTVAPRASTNSVNTRGDGTPTTYILRKDEPSSSDPHPDVHGNTHEAASGDIAQRPNTSTKHRGKHPASILSLIAI